MRKQSSGPSKKTGSNSTYKKASDRKPGGVGDKYPKKREDKDPGDKPYKSRGDKPKRSYGEDRPKGKPGDRSDRPFDKPKRSFGEDRPKRAFGDNKPKRDFGDKPFKKREDSDRPKRAFGENRPAKRFDDKDKPKRSFSGDKPKRDFGDKPFKKREDGDKSKSSFGEYRAKGKFGDKDKPKRDFDKPYSGRVDNDRPIKKFEPRGDRPFSKDKPAGDFKKPFKKDFGSADKPKRSFGEDRPKKDFGDKGKPKKTAEKAPEKKKFGDDIFKREPKKDIIEPTVSELEGFTKSLEEDKPIRGFIANAKKPRIEKEKPVRKKYDDEKTKQYIASKLAEDDNDEEEEEELEKPEQSGLMPLNKFIAHSGECSRREAAELVKKGKVKVNGELVTDPGHKVSVSDTVSLVGKKLTLQKDHVYVLLNKPKDFITTTDDPEGRKTVMDLIAGLGVERVYPVGRLDRNTTGLLLLTNDGDLAQKLSHPSYSIKKVYQVTLDKPLTKTDFDKIVAGVELEDGMAHVDEMAYLEKKNEIGLEIHSGKNRIVRRIFESLGYEVEKLDRMMYAGLTKKNLPRSKWRLLTDKEIILLKHFKS